MSAQKLGMSVHVHSEGDGATHFMPDCVEKAEKITGDFSYPKDGEEVTVCGEFETYAEGEYKYCRLKNASLL